MACVQGLHMHAGWQHAGVYTASPASQLPHLLESGVHRVDQAVQGAPLAAVQFCARTWEGRSVVS